MVEPTIVPRAEHTLSRRQIDPDALKVLYRLNDHGHRAYLVGGSVRDLLLQRRPKDFDIGTTAHPGQIKKLFRNCWIIGRRFRLAHVKFGPKVIEVATFRRKLTPGTEHEPPLHEPATEAGVDAQAESRETRPVRPPEGRPGQAQGERRSHRDHEAYHHENTFGTPEEDAFRRDFTVNALFYDIATFSIIDYVGGLEDLRAGVIRSIGDPNERFLEDPVRMLRAVALSARLGFTMDRDVLDAIATHRAAIGSASPARLLDEYFKILRAGAAARTFGGLAEVGLLEHISPELLLHLPVLIGSLTRLDEYRRRFEAPPGTLTTPVLLGSLVAPFGLPQRREQAGGKTGPRVTLGQLPVARRDVEKLQQALVLQRRLLDRPPSPRTQRAIVERSAFQDALTWMTIHSDTPDVVAYWAGLKHEGVPAGGEGEVPPERQRKRRRRRRRRPRVDQPTDG